MDKYIEIINSHIIRFSLLFKRGTYNSMQCLAFKNSDQQN